MTHFGNTAWQQNYKATQVEASAPSPADATAVRPVAVAPVPTDPTPVGPPREDLNASACGIAPPLPPPQAPYVPVDGRVLQAAEAFEAEVTAMGAHWQRWTAAQDMANAAVLQNRAATAASGGMFPMIDLIRDGGMHYFMRLRMQESHSGAAELRQLAMGAVVAQERHLEEQQAYARAAERAVDKMKPWLARAHTLSLVTHVGAMATTCVAGAFIAVTGGTPLMAGLGAGAVVAGVLGGASLLLGDTSGMLKMTAGVLDVACVTALVMSTAGTMPGLGYALMASKGVDALAKLGTDLLQKRLDSDVREAQARAHLSRLLGSIHERGYAACMDGVQRMGQSHARMLSIINAMLRSNQQVNNLQIRNLRK